MQFGTFEPPIWAGARRLRLILQTEASECGLACVAMVAQYWGHRVDVLTLRQQFSVSMKGATVKSLIAAARMLSLQTRPLRVDIEQISQIKVPCVLHWNMNHFVVLKEVRRGHAVIYDPSVGVRHVGKAELSKCFTGVALEFSPMENFEPIQQTRPLSLASLFGQLTGLRRGLLQLLIIGVALQVFSLIAPFYLQWIIDEALTSSDRPLINTLGIGFLLLFLLQAIASAVRSWMTTILSTDLNYQWFGNIFSHLMRLPLQYFEKRHLGDIVSRFGSVQAIQKSLTTQFVEGILDGVLAVSTLIVMLIYSTQLTAVAVMGVLLYVGLRLTVFGQLRDATSSQIIHAAKQQTHFMESARAAQSIRLFNRGEERRVGWMNILASQFNAELRIAKISITYQTSNVFLYNVERVAIVWLAALSVLDGQFSVGMLLAFLSYKESFSQRTSALVDKLFDLRMLRLHAERVADIVFTQPEYSAAAPLPDSEELDTSIEFSGVAFRYSSAEAYVLKDLSFRIKAGECVAFTGASGCGKTTLMKLMLGLLEPSEGEIFVGGHKMSEIGPQRFRHMIGTVMQDDILFAGSVADNIAFFDPAPTEDRIRESAKLAAIHDEISAMPMGYNTLIGDIGTGLSGGQRQRVLLARALYKSPRILCLDEATSHLDVVNEHSVNSAIQGLALTRVIIAHRSETIAAAQRVIVLESGRVLRDFEQAA